MGRIREFIEIDGQKCRTMFDTGARNSYVVPSVARLLATSKLKKPFRPALGGEIKQVKKTAVLEAKLHGLQVSTHAMVVNKIDLDEDGKPIEILFGALAMQQWGMRPVPDEERLDMTHYPKELVEF